MLTLQVAIRPETGKKTSNLRKAGRVPAVLYGPGISQNFNLEVDAKELAKISEKAGETSFVKLAFPESEGKTRDFLVLIRDLQRDPLKGAILHADFYRPDPKKEIKAKIPLVFKGESAAVKNLGGTLVKNIQEIEIRALPVHLIHQIEVDLSPLNEIGKTILVANLSLPSEVKISRQGDEIVAQVQVSLDVTAELSKPVEEKVEEVEKVEKEKKEEAPAETEEAPATTPEKTGDKNKQ